MPPQPRARGSIVATLNFQRSVIFFLTITIAAILINNDMNIVVSKRAIETFIASINRWQIANLQAYFTIFANRRRLKYIWLDTRSFLHQIIPKIIEDTVTVLLT